MTRNNMLAFSRGTLLDDRYIPGNIARRMARMDEPHIKPLDDLRLSIARATGEFVPAFDPDSGGIHAEALFILRDPSLPAAHDSKIISIDNNDPTARACTMFYDESGLDRRRTLHWNAFPWVTEGRNVPEQARQARPFLIELTGLLPNLKAVVVMGRDAVDSWTLLDLDLDFEPVFSPHPQSRSWARIDRRTGRLNKEILSETFAGVAALLEEPRGLQ